MEQPIPSLAPDPIKPGDLLSLEITDLTPEGDGIAHTLGHGRGPRPEDSVPLARIGLGRTSTTFFHGAANPFSGP